MKLYDLAQSYRQVIDMAEDMEMDVLQDTIESIQESLEDKAENIAKLVKSLEAYAKAIKEEEDRLAAKRKAFENKFTYLKKYLQEQLEHAGLDKIKRPIFTISVQNNPQSVDILDQKLIPTDFIIPVEPKVDKKKILNALKTGEAVPGCELKQTRGLRIR